jgi:hypothetical protein
MQEKEWFAEWFDTPYYHVLYKDRNDDEAAMFIENLISFIVMDGISIVFGQNEVLSGCHCIQNIRNSFYIILELEIKNIEKSGQ